MPCESGESDEYAFNGAALRIAWHPLDEWRIARLNFQVAESDLDSS